LISRSASWREQMRAEPLAPPRRARLGSAVSAADALPNWRSSAWKVRGAIFSLRMSRSRSSRSSSVNRTPVSLSLALTLSPHQRPELPTGRPATIRIFCLLTGV
jgi:hypothetical protein